MIYITERPKKGAPFRRSEPTWEAVLERVASGAIKPRALALIKDEFPEEYRRLVARLGEHGMLVRVRLPGNRTEYHDQGEEPSAESVARQYLGFRKKEYEAVEADAPPAGWTS